MKIYYLMFFILTNCFGPSLVNVGGVKITAGDVITAPSKIEKINRKENDGHK